MANKHINGNEAAQQPQQLSMTQGLQLFFITMLDAHDLEMKARFTAQGGKGQHLERIDPVTGLRTLATPAEACAQAERMRQSATSLFVGLVAGAMTMIASAEEEKHAVQQGGA